MLQLTVGALLTLLVTVLTRLIEAGRATDRRRRRLIADIELYRLLPEDFFNRDDLRAMIERSLADHVAEPAIVIKDTPDSASDRTAKDLLWAERAFNVLMGLLALIAGGALGASVFDGDAADFADLSTVFGLAVLLGVGIAAISLLVTSALTRRRRRARRAASPRV